MMSRFVFAVSISALLALAACSASPEPTDDAAPVVQKLDAPELALPVPEQTRLLLRVHPELARAGAVALQGYAKNVSLAGRAGYEHPARLLLAALLTREHDYERLAALPSEKVAGLFPSMDRSRAMLIALSIRGDEAAWAPIENGVPPRQLEALPMGMWLRVYVPASDATKLRSQMEQFCEPGNANCRSVKRWDAAGDYAIVDIDYGHAPWDDEAREGSGGDDDDDFWNRDTPALRAFLERDAAVSAYMRAEDLPVLLAAPLAAKVSESVAYADSSRRMDLLTVGFDLLGDIFELAAPQAREFEDSAYLLAPVADTGFVFDTVRTYTEQGAKVAKAADLQIELPRVQMQAAALEVDWVRDNPGALDAALLPQWAQKVLKERRPLRELQMVLDSALGWAYLIPTLDYPDAFRATLQHALQLGRARDAAWLKGTEDILAVRARLDWTSNASLDAGGQPVGGIAIATAKGSSLELSLKQAAAKLRSVHGIDVVLDTVAYEHHKVVRISMGGRDGVFGADEVVGQRVRAKLDFDKLAFLLEPMAAQGGQIGPLLQNVLTRAKLALADVERTDKAFGARLQVGAQKLAAIEIPASTAALTQPGLASQCLRSARRISREGLDELRRQAKDEPVDALVSTVRDKLENARAKCDDEASSAAIDEMAGGWGSYAAMRQAEPPRRTDREAPPTIAR